MHDGKTFAVGIIVAMERRFVVVMPVRGRHLESITSGFSRISDSGLEGKGHGLCLFPIAVFQCQRLKIVPGTGHVLFQETQITKCAEIWALSTSVAGLTYTLGQNISDKPIGLKTDGTAEKIISTYQSGNSLGIFNALGISFMLTSAQSSRFWRIGQYFALGLGLVGIMLSGSRSIQIPFLLFLIILLVQFIKQLPPRRRGMTLSVGGVILAFGIAYLLAQRTIINHFIDRLVKQTLADPTASGRTNQWSHSFEVISHMDGGQVLRQLLFGQNPHSDVGGEGLPKFFFMFGVVSTIAFYGGLLYVVWRCWQRRSSRTIAIGILCVFCAFCVDQTFNYPPNVMNVALFAAAALNRSRETSRRIRGCGRFLGDSHAAIPWL